MSGLLCAAALTIGNKDLDIYLHGAVHDVSRLPHGIFPTPHLCVFLTDVSVVRPNAFQISSHGDSKQLQHICARPSQRLPGLWGMVT
jgi:hypothetical protein